MKTTISAFLIAVLVTGCQFSKSVKKNLISGLTATGDILTCNDVYLTINNERSAENSFNYGEMVYLVFNDIQGFTKEGGKVFPLMQIVVTDNSGDTAIFADDLYSEYTEGMDYSPLQLTADVTVATPIKSGGEYTMSVKISDRKGKGTFSSILRFNVRSNERIKADPMNVTYDEIYFYSQGNDKVITDGKINFDDIIYIIIEGLKGFKEENGLVYPGLSLSAVDSEANPLLKDDDLFGEYTETGVAVSDFSSRVSAHFKILGSEFSNPLRVEMLVWDKKSDGKIKVTAEFELE